MSGSEHNPSEKKAVARVAAGIVLREDAFLAALRPEGKPRAGFWEFPGGKCEPGESPRAALARELREELNIAVRAAEFFTLKTHEYSDIVVELHFFQVTEFEGTPEPLDGQELRWVRPREAAKLNFLPADRDIVKALAGYFDNMVK